MKITTKGQVTIPQEIREEFGLLPGTEVDFVAQNDQVVLRKTDPAADPVEDWLRTATGAARGRTTTDRVLEQTRGEN